MAGWRDGVRRDHTLGGRIGRVGSGFRGKRVQKRGIVFPKRRFEMRMRMMRTMIRRGGRKGENTKSCTVVGRMGWVIFWFENMKLGWEREEGGN